MIVSKRIGKVTDIERAITLSREGAGAAYMVAGISTLGAFIILIFILTGSEVIVNQFSFLSILSIAFYFMIGVGISKMSRTAAVLGFVLYAAERIIGIIYNGLGVFDVLIIIFIVMFINGIRGTFAYHRLKEQTKSIDV